MLVTGVQGLPPEQIAPNQDATKFWSNLLELELDREFLSGRLNEIRKDECLGRLKPTLNALISSCLVYARTPDNEDVRKAHSVETLAVLSRCLLSKNLAGWEVMEVFAGGVNRSDDLFNDLTAAIDEILSDTTASVSLRHGALQLAVIFVCGISQLSPGAYFLRRDLFPSIVSLVTSPETEQFTFEAVLLLALLANFHKSDAAKLNPYLRCIREAMDEQFMRKICWASNFAADAVVKAYQSISDDSPPTFGSAFGSFLSSLRPDRALASKPVDPPRELFKNQPIEACVILLPLFEFIHGSSTFQKVLVQSIDSETEKKATSLSPLPYTLLTLSSYLLTHASSSSSPRAIAYANLSLNILLVMVESNEIMRVLCQSGQSDIRDFHTYHYLHLRELPYARCWIVPYYGYVITYRNGWKSIRICGTCVRVCHQVLWYLQRERVRLEYHWQEFWRAIVLLLDFVSSKLDNLITTGGVEQLVQETLLLLDIALYHSERILPSPKAVHELIYELVRAAAIIRKQPALLETLALPQSSSSYKRMSDYYEAKIRDAGVQSAKEALRVVAKEQEKDGLNYPKNLHGADDPPKQSHDVVGFIRPLCSTGIVGFLRPMAAFRNVCSLLSRQILQHRPSPNLKPAARGLATAKAPSSLFASLDTFPDRHIGPDDRDVTHMLSALGYESMDAFVADTVPSKIRVSSATVSNETIPSLSESELYLRARALSQANKPFKSYIGMGYHNAVVPPVVLRNVMESPAWYTPYTPYQPEISQGRLESLVNFQTMIMSLTSMDIANASLLDEATAAAESMVMAYTNSNHKKHTFFADNGVSPQTIAVLQTRARGFGIKLVVGDALTDLKDEALRADLCGVLVQYPDVNGSIKDFGSLTESVHAAGALLVCATDLLAVTLLKPPGEWGADIVLGNSARFGVAAGYGGPHAAFFSCTDKLKRKMPGRLIGKSRDIQGKPAYRLALQTREQHIRREKATSNICTSQALLANMAAMYAVYHGPAGLLRIAQKVHALTQIIKSAVEKYGYKAISAEFFDTLTLDVSAAAKDAEAVHAAAQAAGVNLRRIDSKHVGLTLDESVGVEDVVTLVNVFASAASASPITVADLAIVASPAVPQTLQRTSKFLPHPVFNTHHSETEMLRYIYHLQSKDLGLEHAMIPLGSCTMKLNSTSSMIPLTWPEFASVHPFAPTDQVKGYLELIKELEEDLCKITGFHACSLQPNSGAAGEYSGLSIIRAYHESRGEGHRDICLIPVSAHGTNPASAVMAGLKVIPIKTLHDGNLDLVDLKAKAEKYKDNLAAFMITYPSTFGVFEDGVQDACKIIHDNGGQVYLDGANLNAQVGLTNPATCGGDVCHLNLHKTFAIPHGGGGPGVGPICATEHLAPFLPSHPIVPTGGDKGITAVSAAPYGSASILLISWSYIKMLGGNGLTYASKIALLNANYMAHRLSGHYNLRFKNGKGRVAHELLIDLAEFEKSVGLKVNDFAKRLQDYGFHPPTCSWPISTCMLIEPTESESLEEVDRFCDAMIQIRKEAEDIIAGKQPKDNNVLKNAPHPMSVIALSEEEWNRPYSRQTAAYPVPSLHEKKVLADRQFLASMMPTATYTSL
ncbi:putative glycine dehydrogenase (decarboxylating), mitochondrial [Grifola frondosa]|uniref:glycine dehydrogenase (aminomethyl-transferring) n=1 Tax=Grifola frondosa TaxID=5627 RepID=A0A1C7MP86_GRIFR|nr:putative glycine dehydrogenase (decarboxylating), mitochondrial [Grifola frondosa]